MKIAVYALAKNEQKHAVAWADSCADADLRIVTDTGSTDGTQGTLTQLGVTVCNGYVVPWRWDDAHNLSLNHVPPDVDVCIRLDLDERLQPGWRKAVEAAWKEGVNQLRYRYVWSWQKDKSPGLEFLCDRVHARHGFRWSAPTHEGLVCWTGDRVQALATGLEIHHHRDAGKKHTTDLELLRVAVREAPHDARAHWYLARELDYAGLPEAADAFLTYVKLEGCSPSELSYAYRALARLRSDESHLHQAAAAAPAEPEAWQLLAFCHYGRREWRQVAAYAKKAIEADAPSTHCSDPTCRTKAYDLMAVALWELGERPEALTMAREAVARCPDDPRLAGNVASMERILSAAA
jgi:tetratricopeptide (TPR) repeat protein